MNKKLVAVFVSGFAFAAVNLLADENPDGQKEEQPKKKKKKGGKGGEKSCGGEKGCGSTK